jgi:hypothetical protein
VNVAGNAPQTEQSSTGQDRPPEVYVPDEGISPTALQTFELCARKWGFRKLCGLKDRTAALDLGTLVHKQLELYYRGWVQPDGSYRRQPLDLSTYPGQLAHPMLEWLPDPLDCDVLEVEQDITFDMRYVMGGVDPLQFKGQRDLAFSLKGYPGELYLRDYKTTAGFQWVPTPEVLIDDPQNVLYGLDVMLKHSVDTLDTRWIYSLKAKKGEEHRPPQKAKPVDVVIHLEETVKRAEGFVKLGLQMRSLVRERIKDPTFSPNVLPANFNACHAYGGCPYRASKGGPCGRSSLDPSSPITKPPPLGQLIMTQQNGPGGLDIEALLAQKRAAQGGAPGVPQGPQGVPGYPQGAPPPQGPPPGMGPPPGYQGPPPGMPQQPPPQAYGQPGYPQGAPPPQGPPPGMPQQPPPGYQPPPGNAPPTGYQGVNPPEGAQPQQAYQAPPPHVPQGPPPGQLPAQVPQGPPPGDATQGRKGPGRPPGAIKVDLSDAANAFVQGCGGALIAMNLGPEAIADAAVQYAKRLKANLES